VEFDDTDNLKFRILIGRLTLWNNQAQRSHVEQERDFPEAVLLVLDAQSADHEIVLQIFESYYVMLSGCID